MDLNDLHIFRTVIREGGVTRAAVRLNRVQSNVTTRIRQLEEDLGVTLFLREGRRLVPTNAGRQLLDYADRLLALANEARQSLADDVPRGQLRLGSMETTAGVRLAEPLARFHRRYPDVRLELQTRGTRGLVAQVLAGELDLALVASPVADPRLAREVLFEEELVLVSDAAQPPMVAATELQRRTIISFEEGCAYRTRLEAWFSRAGIMPERIVPVSSYQTILGCVLAGMGVALLPRRVVESYGARSGLRLHPLVGDEGRVATLAVWRQGGATAAIRALLACLREGEGEGEAARRVA